MQHIKWIFLIFATHQLSYATVIKDFNGVFDKKWKLSKTQKEYLEKGKVIVTSNVNDPNKYTQTMNFKVAAIHPLNCTKVLAKLSRYENYHQHVDFIKRSVYDDKKQIVNFSLESDLLPFKMGLRFKIPRIEKPGVYPYQFNHGIFKGLKGNIEVHKYKDHCLFYTYANWIGKDTGIPNTIVELFSEGLSKKSFEILFRMARF